MLTVVPTECCFIIIYFLHVPYKSDTSTFVHPSRGGGRCFIVGVGWGGGGVKL